MTYKVETTQQGRYALVASDGRTVCLFHSEFAAQTACDALNRSNYEPTQDPYALAHLPHPNACEVPARRGRWDQRRVA
jgi:hypothetical protein